MGSTSIELATQLLTKAQRTDFDAEAIALVEDSYSLLAKEVIAFDDEVPLRPHRVGVSDGFSGDRRATRRFGVFGSGRTVDPLSPTGGSSTGTGPRARATSTLKAEP